MTPCTEFTQSDVSQFTIHVTYSHTQDASPPEGPGYAFVTSIDTAITYNRLFWRDLNERAQSTGEYCGGVSSSVNAGEFVLTSGSQPSSQYEGLGALIDCCPCSPTMISQPHTMTSLTPEGETHPTAGGAISPVWHGGPGGDPDPGTEEVVDLYVTASHSFSIGNCNNHFDIPAYTTYEAPTDSNAVVKVVSQGRPEPTAEHQPEGRNAEFTITIPGLDKDVVTGGSITIKWVSPLHQNSFPRKFTTWLLEKTVIESGNTVPRAFQGWAATPILQGDEDVANNLGDIVFTQETHGMRMGLKGVFGFHTVLPPYIIDQDVKFFKKTGIANQNAQASWIAYSQNDDDDYIERANGGGYYDLIGGCPFPPTGTDGDSVEVTWL